MKSASFVFALVALLLLATGTEASVIGGPFMNPANGHDYYMLGAESWTNSEADAIGMGGHLATVRSATENAWILNTFAGYGTSTYGLWIGLTDPTPKDSQAYPADFVWSSGELSGYRHWGSGEPNNGHDDFYTVIVRRVYNLLVVGDWNDVDNNGESFTAYGIVEVVPEPVNCLPLALLTAVCFRRSKQSR